MMKDSSRDAGGAIVTVALVFVVLIVLIVGGGFFFVVSQQRAAALASMQKALDAEHRTIVIAKELEAIVSKEQAVDNFAELRSFAIAKKKNAASTASHDFNPTDEKSATINRLDWLVNHWQNVDGKRSSEEHWIAPRGGIMLGVNRSINGQGKTSFEYLRIESTEDGRMVYYASPMGRGETAFALLEVIENRVVFENLEHDFPQRISYWLDDKRQLHARIDGKINGKSRQSEWIWSAQR